jgi:hypothetical protein
MTTPVQRARDGVAALRGTHGWATKNYCTGRGLLTGHQRGPQLGHWQPTSDKSARASWWAALRTCSGVLGGAHQTPPPAPVPLPQPSAEATPTGPIGPPTAKPAIDVPTMASATADPATKLRISIRFFFPMCGSGFREPEYRRYAGISLVSAKNLDVTVRAAPCGPVRTTTAGGFAAYVFCTPPIGIVTAPPNTDLANLVVSPRRRSRCNRRAYSE